MNWDWQVMAWAAIALLLFAAEAMAPGAFLLWLGLAAAAVFFLVLLLPDLSLLVQVSAFVVLSFAAIQIWRSWFRNREPISDQPLLNRRAAQLIGRVVVLERGIVQGSGRVQIADAYWDVEGPDLPTGTSVRIIAVNGMSLVVEAAG